MSVSRGEREGESMVRVKGVRRKAGVWERVSLSEKESENMRE